jgi:hypothetical protein
MLVQLNSTGNFDNFTGNTPDPSCTHYLHLNFRNCMEFSYWKTEECPVHLGHEEYTSVS